MSERPEGFEVPLYQALTQPILTAGLPRGLAIPLFTISLALAFGARELWVLLVMGALYAGAALATKHDPHFFETFRAAYHNPKSMEP